MFSSSSGSHPSRIILSTLLVLVLGLILATPGRVSAEAGSLGVVWMVCDVSGRTQATIKLPLEWLAACDKKGTIRIGDDEPIHCAELWEQYKGLPTGESREVRRAVDKEGEPYVIRVESFPRPRDRAQGRVHVVSRDERGKKTDIAFPLDLPKLVETIANIFTGFFGGDSARVQIHDVSIDGSADLKRLADYGRFVFLESVDPDSSTVRITID